jgi:2'-5' RNA ligase
MKMAPLRLFIAIDTPPEIKSRVSTVQDTLKSAHAQVSWEPESKLHATVMFLGATDENLVPEIIAALETIGRSAPALLLRYRAVGCFPTVRDPKVVWIGIEDMSGDLASLHGRIELAMENLGFKREHRPFKPHLTLGRVKGMHHLRSLLTMMETITFESQPVTIRELVVVKSELRPTGSVYTILKSIPLNG